MDAKWLVVYTRPGCEMMVTQILTNKKVENYCPLNLVVRELSENVKKIYKPLFTSLVFVNINENQLKILKQVPGIINLMLWLNSPAIIKDAEIQAIKDFLLRYKRVRLEKTTINLKETAQVLSSPLIDYQGNLNTIMNNSIIITLPSLGYYVTAEVQQSNLEVMTGYSLS